MSAAAASSQAACCGGTEAGLVDGVAGTGQPVAATYRTIVLAPEWKPKPREGLWAEIKMTLMMRPIARPTCNAS